MHVCFINWGSSIASQKQQIWVRTNHGTESKRFSTQKFISVNPGMTPELFSTNQKLDRTSLLAVKKRNSFPNYHSDVFSHWGTPFYHEFPP